MKRISLLVGVFLVVCVLAGLYGCASLKTFLNSSTTKLASNSLAAATALRAQGVTIAGTQEGANWLITPTKISGKILSVVLPVGGQEDEGIVPFGAGRPDIAPAQSTLYDFDLSQVTTLHKDTVGLKPGYVGGRCEQLLLLFGYFDVEFLQGATAKKIRMVYGDTGDYVRGDKLIYNANGATTNKFYWYNSTEGFVVETGTRPSGASANTFVKNFSDPVRPNMHYYLLGARLRDNTDYDGSKRNYISLDRSIVEDYDLTFTVDFDVLNAVVFSNVTGKDAFQALTDAQLIEKFDMKQHVSDWSDTQLYCSITFEAAKKFK